MKDDKRRTENVKITGVDLLLDDHGMLRPAISFIGQSIGGVYGFDVVIGKSSYDIYLNKINAGHSHAIAFIMAIMQLFEVENFSDLKYKYARIAINDNNEVFAIGHIMKDEWINTKKIFEKGEWNECVDCIDYGSER